MTTGPPGPQGPQGNQGAQGPQGPPVGTTAVHRYFRDADHTYFYSINPNEIGAPLIPGASGSFGFHYEGVVFRAAPP